MPARRRSVLCRYAETFKTWLRLEGREKEALDGRAFAGVCMETRLTTSDVVHGPRHFVGRIGG